MQMSIRRLNKAKKHRFDAFLCEKIAIADCLKEIM